VNKYNNASLGIRSKGHLLDEMQNALALYKEKVDSMGMNESDRKKLLALPFYMSKRKELSEPKRGQYEFDLFKKMTGHDWFDFFDVERDQEFKITEFDFENYFPQELQKQVRTYEPEFRDLVRLLNLFSQTELEKHNMQKEEFKELMPVLSQLNEEEKETFLHLIANKRREYNDESKLLGEMVLKRTEERLAKISEEENYALKNRYRHQRQTMDYADKKRMPVDKSKLRDVLRHHASFREKFDEEIGTHEAGLNNPAFDHAVLSTVAESTYGEMRDLLREVGIKRDELTVFNVEEHMKLRDNAFVYPSDANFKYLMNALFTPIDMTDYEDTFVTFNETGDPLPVTNITHLK